MSINPGQHGIGRPVDQLCPRRHRAIGRDRCNTAIIDAQQSRALDRALFRVDQVPCADIDRFGPARHLPQIRTALLQPKFAYRFPS